jgi:hypothetical protein
MKNYLITLQPWAHVPRGSIYRGNGKVDFYAETIPDANVVKEKLKEVKETGVVDYVKPGEKTKTSAEIKKEGKPISKPPIVKPPKPKDDGKVKP